MPFNRRITFPLVVLGERVNVRYSCFNMGPPSSMFSGCLQTSLADLVDKWLSRFLLKRKLACWRTYRAALGLCSKLSGEYTPSRAEKYIRTRIVGDKRSNKTLIRWILHWFYFNMWYIYNVNKLSKYIFVYICKKQFLKIKMYFNIYLCNFLEYSMT